jgi:hypothetical protein
VSGSFDCQLVNILSSALWRQQASTAGQDTYVAQPLDPKGISDWQMRTWSRGSLSVDITGTPVSEPSSAALLETALLALGLLLRKGENRDCDGSESASSNCCKACWVRQRT